MNKELLFKAKSKITKEWIESNSIWQSDFGVGTKLWVSTQGWIEIEESTLCRYSGLKDLNGNLIFENDIVRFVDYKIDDRTDDDIEFINVGKIAFQEGQFVVTNLALDEMDDLLVGESSLGVCVIGNSCDNINLLKNNEN